LKYELICFISFLSIIWLSSPHKSAAKDLTITKISRIKQKLSRNKSLLTDKIYKGNHISFISLLLGHCYTLSRSENAFYYLVYSVRSAIKRVIFRFAIFGIFDGP
jgi:hypothetical protein